MPGRSGKTGAPGPDAEAAYAPIFNVIAGPGIFPAATQRLFGIEAEVAFRLARDLPKRDKSYARDEIVAAIASMHPVIELVDTRFADFAKIDALSKLADNQSNAALIYGPAVPGWQSLAAGCGRAPPCWPPLRSPICSTAPSPRRRAPPRRAAPSSTP